MYSDNATNFRGAQRELALAWQAATKDPNLISTLSESGITWRFLPPSAPHFGGLWDAGVRSVKHHLKRVVGSHTLTFEEMMTLLCQIEACLNSRPLSPISDNIEDYSAITPGYFLINSAITAIPEPTLLNVKENRLTRWQLISQLRDHFWKSWLNDYLHSLHQRPKWRIIQALARIGARIVLIRNPLAPPSQWELGRITECHPGSDGCIRVATVKTARSVYTRPITKLCFLPVEINEHSEAIANDNQDVN